MSAVMRWLGQMRGLVPPLERGLGGVLERQKDVSSAECERMTPGGEHTPAFGRRSQEGRRQVSTAMRQRHWMRGFVPPLERGLGGVLGMPMEMLLAGVQSDSCPTRYKGDGGC